MTSHNYLMPDRTGCHGLRTIPPVSRNEQIGAHIDLIQRGAAYVPPTAEEIALADERNSDPLAPMTGLLFGAIGSALLIAASFAIFVWALTQLEEHSRRAVLYGQETQLGSSYRTAGVAEEGR